MPLLEFTESCFTYTNVNCENCNVLTIPDDQQVVLRGKKYLCLCLLCYLAIKGSDYANCKITS